MLNATEVTSHPLVVELHLSPSPELVKKYGKQIKSFVHGDYSQCRGLAYMRVVKLPFRYEAYELIETLLREFPKGSDTCVIFRQIAGFSQYEGNVPSWVVVQNWHKTSTLPDVYASYNAAMMRWINDFNGRARAIEMQIIKPTNDEKLAKAVETAERLRRQIDECEPQIRAIEREREEYRARLETTLAEIADLKGDA